MINDDNKKDNIELHSEDVQEIMGEVPPWILRWGITVIAIVMFIMLAGTFLFHYPEKLSGQITIQNHKNIRHKIIGHATLPATGFGKVKVGQSAKVRIDSYPDSEFGYINGKVTNISTIPDNNGNYHVDITFPGGLVTSYGARLPQGWTMTGTLDITVDDKRLIETIAPALQIFKMTKKHNELFDTNP